MDQLVGVKKHNSEISGRQKEGAESLLCYALNFQFTNIIARVCVLCIHASIVQSRNGHENY